jgi:hypothetical protein
VIAGESKQADVDQPSSRGFVRQEEPKTGMRWHDIRAAYRTSPNDTGDTTDNHDDSLELEVDDDRFAHDVCMYSTRRLASATSARLVLDVTLTR